MSLQASRNQRPEEEVAGPWGALAAQPPTVTVEALGLFSSVVSMHGSPAGWEQVKANRINTIISPMKGRTMASPGKVSSLPLLQKPFLQGLQMALP